MNWDIFFMVTGLILCGLLIIFIANSFIQYIFKPAKQFKGHKILFSSLNGDIISLTIVFAMIGLNIFYIMHQSQSSNNNLTTPLIFWFCVFYGKPSCFIISEKEIFHERQTISADEIEKIKRNYHSVFRTADIKFKDGKEVLIRTPKKVLKSVKQFCELNEIEFKE